MLMLRCKWSVSGRLLHLRPLAASTREILAAAAQASPADSFGFIRPQCSSIIRLLQVPPSSAEPRLKMTAFPLCCATISFVFLAIRWAYYGSGPEINC